MKINWGKFDPYVYIKNNYSSIHNEDKEIIRKLVDFYPLLPRLKLALEIGVGPNLYPVMAMLPFVEKVECIDFSIANLEYLEKQLEKPDKNWYQFWKLYKKLNQSYDIDLAKNLKRKVEIRKGSIYKLNKGKYDIASMFFCAESITTKRKQFVVACKMFIKSVRTGGYLVAAFMENSKGYKVGDKKFPSYPVDTKLIKKVFAPETDNLVVTRIPIAKQPLRSGYTGMIFLTASV